MPLSEALEVTLEVARVLDGLDIAYLVGGSLASSLHGIPRATEDADLVADLRLQHVRQLTDALAGGFYIDQDHVQEAIARLN